MKTQFKQWLINQNSDFINGCGIECILSKLDDELNILPCDDPTVAHEEETQDTTLLTWGWMSYLMAVGYGLYKLFVYYNSTIDSLKKNAYVGGDAYNYIINGTHATAFCVIGLVFAVMGTSCFIVNAINKKK